VEGELYVAQGQFERAADAFIAAFDAEPSADLAIFAFAANSRTERARPEAQLVLWTEQHPRDVVGNFALGTVLLARGELDAAVARFETVHEVNPEHTGALNNLAWIHGERGDERALDLAQRAHELAPADPAIADTLGWIQVRGGVPERGLPLLERAAAALPNELEVRYHWAVALAETNARSEALAVLEDLVGSGLEFRSRDAALEKVRTLRGGRNRRAQ
jgi:tetratricopeptide (TPR) repeat protein